MNKNKGMRETDTHIFFWGDDDVYSNFYRFEFKYKGKTFFCSEQAFMWEKAMLFGDKNIAGQILKSTHPYECKKLGRKVKNYDDKKWGKVREDIWKEILINKFSSEPLKSEILKTKNKILVEASPYDKLYGIGLEVWDDRVLDENNWKGKNLLGKILMGVREDLNQREMV